jgi:hypothetical protein
MSREELERWNQRFSAAEYVFGTAPNAFLAAHAALFRPGQRALCVAERVSAALKPAGLLLVEGYTPAQLKYGTGGPKQVEQLYTEALLRQAFGSLEILELNACEAELDEGTRHRGMSAVIDLVARKPA